MSWMGVIWALLLMFGLNISADAGPLCVDGHPASRPADVTYGHLKARSGYERDHFIPLCLGGEDEAADDPSIPPDESNPGNVWYQPIEEAHKKDADERRACEAFCAGKESLENAIQGIVDRWGDR